MRKHFRFTLLCQLCFLILTAPPALGQNEPSEPASTNHWRFAHFASGVRPFDVYLNGELTGLQNIEFSGVTGWQAVSAGTYELAVTAVGETAVLFSLSLVLNNDDWITVAATGTINELTSQIITEDHSPTAENEARLMVLNGETSTRAMDILADGAPILENIHAANGSTNVATVEIEASTYDIHVTRAGENNEVLIDAGTVELLPHRSYLAAAVGMEEDPRLIVVGTELEAGSTVSSSALLRVAHLSSGTPALDVYLNGELTVFQGLDFPQFSQWVALPAGGIIFSVALEGETQTVVTPFEVVLEANTYTTVAVIGALANDTLEAQPMREDFSPLAPDFVRVNVLNAHPGSGPINIQSTDETAFIEDLGYPGFFGSNNGFNQFVVENGSYDLQIIQSETGDIIADLPGTNLFAGRNYFISAINANPPFVLTFSDIAETQSLLGQ